MKNFLKYSLFDKNVQFISFVFMMFFWLKDSIYFHSCRWKIVVSFSNESTKIRLMIAATCDHFIINILVTPICVFKIRPIIEFIFTYVSHKTFPELWSSKSIVSSSRTSAKSPKKIIIPSVPFKSRFGVSAESAKK